MRFFPCVVKTQMLWLSFGINSKKSVTNIDKLGYSRCKDILGIGSWKFFYEYYAFQQHMLSFSSNKSKLNEIPADTVVPSLFSPKLYKRIDQLTITIHEKCSAFSLDFLEENTLWWKRPDIDCTLHCIALQLISSRNHCCRNNVEHLAAIELSMLTAKWLVSTT